MVLSYPSTAQPGYPLLGSGRYQICYQFSQPTNPFAVFLAEDLHTDQQVVIKQVNRWATSPQAPQQNLDILYREEALLRRIQHAHLPSLIETFFDGDAFSLVLSFIAGTPLETYLSMLKPKPRRQCYTQRAVIAFGLAICRILDYLHTLTPPIIHRDVKPANIIQALDGFYALIDLGNGRQYGANLPLTSGQLWKFEDGSDTIPGIGTPGYAPPELYGIEGIPSRTTPASDLYSVAAIMHQMLTGHNPGKKPLEERFHYVPLSPYVRVGGVSNDLAALIMQMLAWKMEQRPQSAYEVIQRLQAIAHA